MLMSKSIICSRFLNSSNEITFTRLSFQTRRSFTPYYCLFEAFWYESCRHIIQILDASQPHTSPHDVDLIPISLKDVTMDWKEDNDTHRDWKIFFILTESTKNCLKEGLENLCCSALNCWQIKRWFWHQWMQQILMEPVVVSLNVFIDSSLQ